jgi:hypothetical protein
VVTAPVDAGEAGAGVVTAPVDAGEAGAGVVAAPVDAGEAGTGVVTAPVDAGEAGAGVVAAPVDAGVVAAGKFVKFVSIVPKVEKCVTFPKAYQMPFSFTNLTSETRSQIGSSKDVLK